MTCRENWWRGLYQDSLITVLSMLYNTVNVTQCFSSTYSQHGYLAVALANHGALPKGYGRLPMRIRTYLTFSYLVIAFLVAFGASIQAEWIINKFAKENVYAAEQAIKSFTEANLLLSENLLRLYGMRIVEMKADEVASSLSNGLAGKFNYDYEQLRNNKELRTLATQHISAYNRAHAGYVEVYDRTGVTLWHPNRNVEGRNFAKWKDEFPDMWECISRSFVEEKVSGYYDFLDENSVRRKKYSVLQHVRGTPFIVAATVNIDDFFKPVHDEMTSHSDEALAQANIAIAGAVDSTRYKLRLIGIMGSLLLLGIGALFALWFAHRVSRPIMGLRDAVQRMGRGNWSQRVPEQGAVEVRSLGSSFNALGEQLTKYVEKRDFVRDTFGRYLSQEVVARLLTAEHGLELGGESRRISMIMSDIRGFTALIEDLSPEQVVSFLNRYLARMVEIVSHWGGVVDEIMGDGIFAIFGAPELLPEHPARAVACAIEMQMAMDEINGLNVADGFGEIEIGIAVHTGTVVVGNIGSEKRTKYGAVGSEVNFAGRMEGYAVGGQVLISHSTYDSIPHRIEISDVLDVKMKGMRQTAVLYDVVGVAEPYDVHLITKTRELVPLRTPVAVILLRLERKVVAAESIQATITHCSPKLIAVTSAESLSLWEDVKIEMAPENAASIEATAYAKVTSVKHLEGRYDCVLRFTSVTAGMREELDRATIAEAPVAQPCESATETPH